MKAKVTGPLFNDKVLSGQPPNLYEEMLSKVFLYYFNFYSLLVNTSRSIQWSRGAWRFLSPRRNYFSEKGFSKVHSWQTGLIPPMWTVGLDTRSLSQLSNTFRNKAFGENSVYVNYEAERDFRFLRPVNLKFERKVNRYQTRWTGIKNKIKTSIRYDRC